MASEPNPRAFARLWRDSRLEVMLMLAIVQARMSSTRLPGKVMADLSGAPMIERQIERIARARSITRLVVATSDREDDAPLATQLERKGVAVFRGSLTDVLARFIGAVEAFGPAAHVMRLTADCPLTDWRLIDAVAAHHLKGGYDYTSNDLVRTFAHGLDVEIATTQALRAAHLEADDPAEREHVTPFIYRRPDRFHLGSVTQTPDQSAHRWTVDTPADLAFVRRVYQRLYSVNPAFTSEDVLALDFSHLAADA